MRFVRPTDLMTSDPRAHCEKLALAAVMEALLVDGEAPTPGGWCVMGERLDERGCLVEARPGVALPLVQPLRLWFGGGEKPTAKLCSAAHADLKPHHGAGAAFGDPWRSSFCWQPEPGRRRWCRRGYGAKTLPSQSSLCCQAGITIRTIGNPVRRPHRGGLEGRWHRMTSPPSTRLRPSPAW